MERRGKIRLERQDLAMRVRREQLTLLYRQLPTSITGTLIGTFVLVVAIWPPASGNVLFAWLAIVLANQVRRGLLYRRFDREGIQDHTIDRWELYWVLGSGFSGLLWGVTPFLFLSTADPSEQLVLTVLVFGVATGAIPFISTHMPTSYAFTIPALLPFVVHNAFLNSKHSYLLMVIETTVMLAILSFGRNYSRSFTNSLRIRFENEALAEQLKHRNSELRRAHEATKTVSRAKSQFFAAASHDLRQPLHALGLFASALNEKTHEPGASRLVASVKASVNALENLFNELLDISKIDAGGVKVNLEHFQAGRMLDRLRSEFESEASAKGLRLSVRPCPAYLHSDPVLLERVLRNLVSNALRYTERGGVLLGCRRRRDRMVFEVWDTGIGIPGDQQHKVFEEFFQIGNPERSSRRGLGLGLSIVKRLSDLLGYRIVLASRPGQGTMFRFSVPLGTPPKAAAVRRVPEQTRGDIAGSLIVVIDDEAAIVEGMTWLLSDWGAEVIGSASGDDVAEKVYAAGRMPDIIIADYWLAGGRIGAHVVDALRRELDPEIPAILITGSTSSECVQDANRFHCGLLLKPADPTLLRALIASKLRKGPPASEPALANQSPAR